MPDLMYYYAARQSEKEAQSEQLKKEVLELCLDPKISARFGIESGQFSPQYLNIHIDRSKYSRPPTRTLETLETMYE